MYVNIILILLLSTSLYTMGTENYDTWMRNEELQQKGKIIIIEDIVNVNISFHHLLHLPIQIDVIQQRLQDIYATLNSDRITKLHLESSSLLTYRSMLAIRLETLNETLENIRDNVPAKTKLYSHRTKRGLFDLG